MKNTRRLIFWILLAGSLGVSGWWVLSIPYQPGRLLHYLPARAAFVSIHRHLPERLEAFAENPVAISLFSPTGLDSRELRDLFHDESFRALAGNLFGREVACAYIPSFGPHGRPAWILASWIGGRSQRFRWRLSLFDHPDLQRAHTPAGRTYWVLRSTGEMGGQSLYVFLAEGILVGCLSGDPLAVEQAIDVAENRRPSAAMFGRPLRFSSRCAVEASPDHGWLNLLEWGGSRTWRSPVLWYQVEEITSHTAAGRLCSPVPLMHAGSLQEGSDLSAFGRLYGDVPLAFCAIDSQSRPALLKALAPAAWSAVVEELLGEHGEGSICLSVVGGDYSGQYLELKVPGLLGAIRIRDPERCRTAMLEFLDGLNERHHWGLYAREIMAGDRLVHVVETSQKNPFSLLALEERPAFTVCDHMLVVASSLKSLQAMLARYDRAEAMEASTRGAWWPGASRHPAYAWFSLKEFAKSLRTAVKFYRLKTMYKNPQTDLPGHGNSDNLTAWLDALAAFASAELWMDASMRETELRFKLSAGDE